MLVTFRTSNYSNVTFFGDQAVVLLRMMGHSGTVPSAMVAEDVPQALARLRAAVAAAVAQAPAAGQRERDETDDDDEPQEPAVSLASRALPLIELLEAAVRSRSNVMWDS